MSRKNKIKRKGRYQVLKINQILEINDDSDLCACLHKNIVSKTGEDIEISHWSEGVTAFSLVSIASGIIDNGGFQYLFEGNFKGDPGYLITKAAFHTVHARVSAAAFEEALSLFTNGELPENIELRLDLYQEVDQEVRNAIDFKFWSGSDEIEHLLAVYVRTNQAQFKQLK